MSNTGRDNYAERLIRHKARQLVGRYGFTLSDREDIEQELRLHLLQCMQRFDPNLGGCNTYISRVINRKIVSMLRHRLAEQREYHRVSCSLSESVVGEGGCHIERSQTLDKDVDARLADGRSHVEDADLALDLQATLAKLSPELRRTCEVLMTLPIGEAAQALGISRFTLRARRLKLRQILSAHELQDYLPDKAHQDPGPLRK